jgi:hypothetical protein
MRWTGWLLIALLLVACRDRSGPPVEIVVPDGFRGSFWIVLDPTAQDIPVADGRHIAIIPANGVLRVRSFLPLARWHAESARYASGAPLPIAHPGDAMPDRVAVRGGNSAATVHEGKELQWMPYFVGTADQYAARAARDLPPATGR